MDFDARRYGPWALVTGASSGIGEQFARHLAAAGIHLVLVARRRECLQAIAAELTTRHGVEIDVLDEDLAAPDAADRVAAATAGRDIGLVVSNAGDSLRKREFTADSRAALERMFDLNARFPLLLLHAMVPRLRARGRGGIVLTGSIEGEIPFPYSSAYPATKAFIHSLGQCLYGELAPAGVDVLVLAPGATATAALTRQGLDADEMSNVMTPMDVSGQALRQLGRRPLHVAGRSNRILVGLLRLMPRAWAIAIAAKGTLSMMRKTSGSRLARVPD